MHRNWNSWLAGLALTLLLVAVLPASAQDDATRSVDLTDAIIVGDIDSPALDVVRQFLEDSNTDVLADDLTYFDRTLPEPIVGRDAYINAGVGTYGDTFTDFFYQPRRYVVAENTVVVEFEFTGTPSGDAETVASSAVAVPMVGIFDVQDSHIQRIDMFYDAAGLQYQLGYDPYYDPYYDTAYLGATAPGAAPANALTGSVDLDVDEIVEDTERFLGTEVIVEGVVGAALNDHSFLLVDDDLLDLDQEQVLVIDRTQNGLNFVQMADTSVLIAGEVRHFVRADVEAELGITLDEATFAPYEGQPVLLAVRAANLYDVATLENVINDPDAFYGQMVSIRGDVVEHLGTNGLVMDDDDLIDFDPERILVLMPSAGGADALPPLNETIVATGMVRAFVRADFEREYGLTLDATLYADYEALPVIVAESVYVEE